MNYFALKPKICDDNSMTYRFFLFFCLYIPFQIALNPVEGIDLASGRVFILILALMWLISGLKNKKVYVPARIQTFLMVSFLFICGLSLFWAENLDWGVRKFLFLLSIFPIYFVTAGLRPAVIPSKVEKSKKLELDPSSPSDVASESAQDDNAIVKFLIWGAGLAAITGIIQFLLQFIIGLDITVALWRNYATPLFLGKSFLQMVLEYPSWLVNIGSRDYLRVFSSFPDPHMLSFYLGLALPLTVTLYFSLRKKMHLMLSIIILLADLLTFSRGGYIGLVAGLIFIALYFTFNNKKINPKKILAFLVLLLFLFISLVLTPVGKRAMTSFNTNEGSNKGRFENWSQAIEITKNNPLGVGIGNYSYKIEPSAGYRKPIYAHNLYLDIAAETGIINAIIFILLIAFSIKAFIKKSKDNILWLGGAVSLIIFSFHSIFDTALYSAQVLPLLLIVIALSTINVEKTD